MGGSGGGGGFFDKSESPEEISKNIRKEEEDTKDLAFESSVSQYFKELLIEINDRDNEQIQTHIDLLKNALELGIDGTIDIRYGGSISKHTYVDGISDIDSLAIINNSELINSTPNQVREYFYNRIKERLPNTEIKLGKLAITVKFTTGFEIQILPTIKVGDGIKIQSSRNSNEWSNIIQPKKFVESLRYVNMKTNGKLVPMIKLAKSIINNFPESRKLSGYHVECLAVEIFNSYKGVTNTKEMLKYFFQESTNNVLRTIKDKTGQSIKVDNYLGENNSIQRKMASDSLSTISRRMKNADGAKSIKSWENIFDYGTWQKEKGNQYDDNLTFNTER